MLSASWSTCLQSHRIWHTISTRFRTILSAEQMEMFGGRKKSHRILNILKYIWKYKSFSHLCFILSLKKYEVGTFYCATPTPKLKYILLEFFHAIKHTVSVFMTPRSCEHRKGSILRWVFQLLQSPSYTMYYVVIYYVFYYTSNMIQVAVIRNTVFKLCERFRFYIRYLLTTK